MFEELRAMLASIAFALKHIAVPLPPMSIAGVCKTSNLVTHVGVVEPDAADSYGENADIPCLHVEGLALRNDSIWGRVAGVCKLSSVRENQFRTWFSQMKPFAGMHVRFVVHPPF